ncbi:hypothetical protein SEA_JACKO_65 [Microbacterium phage Jacko]|nr:hypothetical protein SEA_JACKO_65 [Microbacterium phage Jacko]
MNKFKVGDKVRRIDGGSHLMPVGEVCVVSWVNDNGGLTVEGRVNFWEDRYFELVEAASTEDLVNHPSHYTSDPSGVECIQITRHRNFNIGNAFKYLWRNGLKDSAAKSARDKQVEDLRKAIFCIEDEIKRIEDQE